jgi:hypothetical protein
VTLHSITTTVVCSIDHPEVQSFCLSGAVQYVAYTNDIKWRHIEVLKFLREILEENESHFKYRSVVTFNDYKGYKAVLELLHLAVEEAEGR